MSDDPWEEPRFKEMPGFRLAGRMLRTNEAENRRLNLIPRLWADLPQDREFQAARDGAAAHPALLGLSSDFDGVNFSYWAGFAVAAGASIPDKLASMWIPAQRYAVFTTQGHFPECVWKLVDYIQADWLKAPGRQRGDGPDFEWYDGRFDFRALSGEMDLYVPIR
jgi:predicted transcriptional regulator YdeE